MTHYEFLGLIPGTFSENEVEPVVDEIAGFFVGLNASITRKELLGRRKTAYPIGRLRHGYYMLMEFDLKGEKLHELEQKLKLYQNLLRFLIIKIQPKTREEIEKEKLRREKQKKEKPLAKEAREEKKEEQKVSKEELEKKLDEILKGEIK